MNSFLKPDGTLDQVARLSIPLFVFMILFILAAEIGIVKRKAHTRVRVALFLLYLLLNLYETLLFRVPTAEARYNLELFWSYRLAFSGNTAILSEILLNILLYVPFGFLLEDSRHLREKPGLILLLAFLCSLGTEAAQLLAHRGLFEFDDILDNTLGCVIGIGIRKMGMLVF